MASIRAKLCDGIPALMTQGLITAFAVMAYFVPAVSAETSCSCSYSDWVGDCSARLEKRENNIEVVSGTKQCSRVDWYLDGQPQVTIVLDGTEILPYFGQKGAPQLVLQSCKICKDSRLAISKDPIADVSVTLEQGPREASLDGRWKAKTTGLFGRQQATLELSITGSKVSGSWRNEKGLSSPVTGDVRDGGDIVLSLTQLGRTKYTLKRVGADTMTGQWKEGVFSGSVELQRDK